MTLTPEKAYVVLSIVGLLLLWALWSFGLRPALIDMFRQRVFEIRDEMFDYAAEGNIDFNHPAYGTIRTLMNGYIRFAHRIDISLFIVLIVYFIFKKDALRKQQKEFQERIESQLSSLPEKQRGKMNAYLQRTQVEMEKYVLYGSPLFTAVVLLLSFVIGIVVLLVKKLSIREQVEAIKHEYVVGFLDPKAFSEGKRNPALAA